MEKTYLVDARLDIRIGVYDRYSNTVFRNGYVLDVDVKNPDYVLKQVTIENTLNAYAYNGDEMDSYNLSTYELREKGRYYAIIVDDMDGEMLAVLCSCKINPETGGFYIVQTPFESIYDRPASYIENPLPDTFTEWVVMDYSFR